MDVRRLIRRFGNLPRQNVPGLRAERIALSAALASEDRATVLGLARGLIAGGVARFVAYELIRDHKPTMDRLTAAEVEELGKGIGNWADIDAFGCFVAGPAWRTGRISDRTVRKWAASPDWCWRRAALVCTVALNCIARGGTGDTRRTIELCTLLAGDRHDMVQKALSWALRELAKRDAASVKKFLIEHEGAVAARVKREVTNKLTTGLKTPRRGLRRARQ